MDSVKHICIRYFIVPFEGYLFITPADPNDKNKWLREKFFTNKNFTTITGKDYAIRIVHEDKDRLYGKISRQTKEKRHILTPDDIQDDIVDDWPYVTFVVHMDSQKQLLVTEYISEFMPNISTFCKDLSEIASSVMTQYGYYVSFETINDEISFWKLADSAQGIYSVKFSLVSPNIFGAGMKANQSLKELQSVFNNNRMDIQIINDNGKLMLPRDRIDSYREYADQGGGNWIITVKQGKVKKRHNSSQKAKKVTVVGKKRADQKSLDSALADYEKNK